MMDATIPTTKSFGYNAVDLSQPLRIRYKGSQAAAHISIAATTGDITFEQGATTAAADTTTGSNPQVGATPGIIDISNALVADFHSLKRQINLTADWEAWLVDVVPDEATEITAANAMFFTTLTDQDCTGALGFALLADTSLKTAEDFQIGVSLNGPETQIHGTDIGTLVEVYELEANVTYAGATDGIYVYACNDIDGTKVQIDKLPLVSATLTYFPLGGANSYPYWAQVGRRIVFKAQDASGALTAVTSLRARARLTPIYPVTRIGRTWAAKSIP